MKFFVTVDRDEDGVWVAECPAIPGCVSQGDTREEALANIREAITLCLEVRAERGLPLTIETKQVEVALQMPPLPSLSGREVVQIFESLGWEAARRRGSHIVLVKEGSPATLSIPDHRTVAKGTLRSLIRAADMTVSEFVAAAADRQALSGHGAGAGTADGPSGRIDHALVYDRASESLIMFGGRSTETSGADIRNETWEYRPQSG